MQDRGASDDDEGQEEKRTEQALVDALSRVGKTHDGMGRRRATEVNDKGEDGRPATKR